MSRRAHTAIDIAALVHTVTIHAWKVGTNISRWVQRNVCRSALFFCYLSGLVRCLLQPRPNLFNLSPSHFVSSLLPTTVTIHRTYGQLRCPPSGDFQRSAARLPSAVSPEDCNRQPRKRFRSGNSRGLEARSRRQIPNMSRKHRRLPCAWHVGWSRSWPTG